MDEIFPEAETSFSGLCVGMFRLQLGPEQRGLGDLVWTAESTWWKRAARSASRFQGCRV